MESLKAPSEYMQSYDGFEMEWISTSALSLLMQCGMAFYYKYILRVAEAITVRMTAGTGTHAGREWNLKQKMITQIDVPVEEVTDAARDKVHMCFDSSEFMPTEDFEVNNPKKARDKTIDLATDLAKKDYITFQRGIYPKGVEEAIAVRYKGLNRLVCGKIDTLMDDLKIVDLKTGKRSFGQEKADVNMGLTTYGMLILAKYGKMVPRYEIQNVIRGQAKCSSQFYTTYRNKEDLQRQLMRFIAAVKNIDAGNFLPCDPSHWKCGPECCGYFRQCKYGGAKL